MVENESPMKIFHSHTDTRVNVMTSHIQHPIRIGTPGSLGVGGRTRNHPTATCVLTF